MTNAGRGVSSEIHGYELSSKKKTTAWCDSLFVQMSHHEEKTSWNKASFMCDLPSYHI